jgi:hypothetical protein
LIRFIAIQQQLNQVPCGNAEDGSRFADQHRKGLFHKELKEAAISRSNGIISALLAYSLLNCGKAHPGHFSVYKKKYIANEKNP